MRKTGERTGAAESELTIEANDDGAVQVQFPVQPARALSCIPVLLPQHAMGGSYAVYVHPSSVKPHPSGLAVRSMTFEEKAGGSPSSSTKESSVLEKPNEKNMAAGKMQATNPQLQKHDSAHSPPSPASALKRPCTEVPDNSPSKALKTKNISEVTASLQAFLQLTSLNSTN